MLPSLLVAAAITAPAAPLPKDAAPNPTGPAPRVAAVKADAGGTVWVTATVYRKQKFQQQFVAVENGKQVVKQQEVEQVVSNYVRKTLADFGGKFVTADGTPLTAEQATKRVKDGAALLVSADGKPVDAGWLRAVSGDTVVMLTDELAHAHFQFGAAPLPTTAAPRLAMLGTDAAGVVRLPVNPNAVNANGMIYNDFNGRIRGGRVVFQANGEIIEGGLPVPQDTRPAGADGKKALEDIRFEAFDVSGKRVPRAEALARLKAGGLVVLAGDNRFPDEQYLTPLRGEVLVLVSAELVFPAGQPNPYDLPATKPGQPAKPAAGNPVQVVPAIQLPAVQVRPAVIKQVQIEVAK